MTLKNKKNKNQISREENQKDYDDELDDHVDANDIVVSIKKDRSKRDLKQQVRNPQLRKDQGFQGSLNKD